MTAAEARRLVAIACAACPTQGGRLDRDQIKAMGDAWTALLADVTYDDAAAALKRWLATSHWLPAPAQIRTLVSEAQAGRTRPGAEAWGDVLREVARCGRYRTPRFDDALVARAVDAMTWMVLCDSQNQTADRARFIELYDQLATRAAEDRSVATLPGVSRPALPQGAPQSLAEAMTLVLPAGSEDNNDDS